jgi:sodium transport system ATP-binding protein
MIEARGLYKSFGEVAAVRGVSFAARNGQITGLLGPNGAGKSTTLRMLYTVLKPNAGDALIDGTSVTADPLAARRAIGVLSHGAGVYNNLTARENILYFGELHGLSVADRESRAAELIEHLEMQEFADRLAKGFSQGQKLKTALARALVHRPRNVLLDEPTNGLDVMAVRNLRKLLGRLRDDGHCVLFSSHVMQEVEQLCDEVVVIAGGEVVAAGGLADIRARAGSAQLEDAFVHLMGGVADHDKGNGGVADHDKRNGGVADHDKGDSGNGKSTEPKP